MSIKLDPLAETILRHQVEDMAIADEEVPWIPYALDPTVLYKPLRFNVRTGSWTNLVWITKPGGVGRHQHHGEVIGYTLEGSWFYEEYDWVARPGTLVHEAPGAIHTLRCEDPAGMKTLFTINGTMDFMDDDGQIVHRESVYYFINEYERYCEVNGIDVNRKLFY